MSHNDGNKYPTLWDGSNGNAEWKVEMRDRLEFTCKSSDTLLFTGTGEPTYNLEYVSEVIKIAKNELSNPFVNIEIQTCGVDLDDDRLSEMKNMGIKTIALSIASFDNEENGELCRTPKDKTVDIEDLCNRIVNKFRFNLRLTFNLNKTSEKFFDNDANGNPNAKPFYEKCSKLGAAQVTFRRLTATENTSKPAKWVNENNISLEHFKSFEKYIVANGTKLEALPFGLVKYAVDGMSSVLDDDCCHLAYKDTTAVKSGIIRENVKLYTRWYETGSLIF
jgi:coproporphyrinogen III oxidase-like Fe-S oxidoreductase